MTKNLSTTEENEMVSELWVRGVRESLIEGTTVPPARDIQGKGPSCINAIEISRDLVNMRASLQCPFTNLM